MSPASTSKEKHQHKIIERKISGLRPGLRLDVELVIVGSIEAIRTEYHHGPGRENAGRPAVEVVSGSRIGQTSMT
jgi:hypothetical protein